MVVYFYTTVVPGFYSLLLLGSNLFPTLCFSVVLGSYSVHIILCTKLCWFCAFIFIKPTIKKTKRNNTEQKNPYYKIIIIEALNKKNKQKIEKHLFLIFPAVFVHFISLHEKVDLYLTARKSGYLWPIII